MPVFNVTRRVAHPAGVLHGIVSDVASYDEFLPLCESARIWNERELGDGKQAFRAELIIAYPKFGLRENFVSDVTTDATRLTVLATSSEGPIAHLENRWRFVEVSKNSCDVVFALDYKMKSRPLQFIMSQMFDHAVRKMMNAFEERARVLQHERK